MWRSISQKSFTNIAIAENIEHLRIGKLLNLTDEIAIT